ncbi:NADH-quinone oxidoreductase subunit J [bacterium]|nr:NADH-quinone oxidoreductase subunit J [bacterium]
MIFAVLPDILFYLFALLAVGGALSVLTRRNPMTCAASLVVSVLSVALLYFLLSAHFVGVAQMIVYAGAIVVLFIFVIMLLNLTDRELGRGRMTLFKIFGAFLALSVLAILAPGMRSMVELEPSGGPGPAYGGTAEVGRLLFGEYLLPFELTSILILAAMVAGVVLAKRDLTPKRLFSLIDWLLALADRLSILRSPQKRERKQGGAGGEAE